MKKFILVTAVITTFGLYVIEYRFGGRDDINVVPPATVIPNTSTTGGPSAIAKYKDGSYIGPSTDAFYGNVQVKAIISGGKITDVQFLDYPQDRQTSIIINGQAMPYLKQEAIQSQSAKVDIISGATQTSMAFQQSLQSALTNAKTQ